MEMSDLKALAEIQKQFVEPMERRFFKERPPTPDEIKILGARLLTKGLVIKFFGLTSFVFEKLDKGAGTAASAQAYCLLTQLSPAKTPAHHPSLCIPRLALLPGSSDPDAVTPDVAIYFLKRSRVHITGGASPGLAVNMGPESRPCNAAVVMGLRYFLSPAKTIFSGDTLKSQSKLTEVSDAVIELTEGRVEHDDDKDSKEVYDRPTEVTIDGKAQTVRQVLYYGIPNVSQVQIEIASLAGDPTRHIFLDTNSRVFAGIHHLPATEGVATPGMPLDDLHTVGLMLVDAGTTKIPQWQKFCDGLISPQCGCCPPLFFS